MGVLGGGDEDGEELRHGSMGNSPSGAYVASMKASRGNWSMSDPATWKG